MGLGTVRRLTRWTNTGTAGPLGVNPVQAKSSGQTTERDGKELERRRRSAETERQANLD